MTEDEVRAATERLVQFPERFVLLLGEQQAQDQAYTYVKGLMICPERKSIEIRVVEVVDESGFAKKGDHNAGLGRQ